MNDDTTIKSSASGTTCRIAPPADERFDEEAFLLREMAEAKAALRRTVGAVKLHAGHDLAPRRLLRRHPLAAAGAAGVGGLWLVRRILKATSGRRSGPVEAALAQAAPKAGLLAMLIPSAVAIVQSLSAAKMTDRRVAATNPQAWMVDTLWGLARDRFGKRRAPPAASAGTKPADGVESDGSKPGGSKSGGANRADSRPPATESSRRRPTRPR